MLATDDRAGRARTRAKMPSRAPTFSPLGRVGRFGRRAAHSPLIGGGGDVSFGSPSPAPPRLAVPPASPAAATRGALATPPPAGHAADLSPLVHGVRAPVRPAPAAAPAPLAGAQEGARAAGAAASEDAALLPAHIDQAALAPEGVRAGVGAPAPVIYAIYANTPALAATVAPKAAEAAYADCDEDDPEVYPAVPQVGHETERQRQIRAELTAKFPDTTQVWSRLLTAPISPEEVPLHRHQAPPPLHAANTATLRAAVAKITAEEISNLLHCPTDGVVIEGTADLRHGFAARSAK